MLKTKKMYETKKTLFAGALFSYKTDFKKSRKKIRDNSEDGSLQRTKVFTANRSIFMKAPLKICNLSVDF